MPICDPSQQGALKAELETVMVIVPLRLGRWLWGRGGKEIIYQPFPLSPRCSFVPSEAISQRSPSPACGGSGSALLMSSPCGLGCSRKLMADVPGPGAAQFHVLTA